MSIRKAIRHFLSSQTAVTDLVGGASNPRIRPVRFDPEDTFPAISFRKVSAGNSPDLIGGDDLPSPTFEIVSWANDLETVEPIAEAIQEAIEDEGPDAWNIPGGSVVVTSVTLIDEEDVAAEEPGGEGVYAVGIRQVIEIQYRKA